MGGRSRTSFCGRETVVLVEIRVEVLSLAVTSVSHMITYVLFWLAPTRYTSLYTFATGNLRHRFCYVIKKVEQSACSTSFLSRAF